jgi:hypothetical protein
VALGVTNTKKSKRNGGHTRKFNTGKELERVMPAFLFGYILRTSSTARTMASMYVTAAARELERVKGTGRGGGGGGGSDRIEQRGTEGWGGRLVSRKKNGESRYTGVKLRARA